MLQYPLLDYPQENPPKSTSKVQRWRAKNPIRYAFLDQRCNAKKRGIPFEFSFEEWVEWWGEDINRRGCNADGLVMARYGDDGPYQPDNVYKSKASDNCRLSYENNPAMHGSPANKGAGISLPRAS
jgi:hypothetical protein